MARFVVTAVANDVIEREWEDRETKKMVKHTGLTMYVGNESKSYSGALPLGYRSKTDRDGKPYQQYIGKVTAWDSKLDDGLPQVGDIVDCEYTPEGSLRFVGIAE